MEQSTPRPRWKVIHERGRYCAADCFWAFDTQHVSGTPARDVLCGSKREAQDIVDRFNAGLPRWPSFAEKLGG